MSYEEGKTAKFLATECLICSRPLTDPVSIETAVGPICRKKFGYDNLGLSEEDRTKAKELIYEAAVEAEQQNVRRVFIILFQLKEMGFNKLAEVIEERFNDQVPVRIYEDVESERLLITAPYNETSLLDWRMIPGRYFKRETKQNVVPASQRPALFHLLRKYYGGKLANGPKGLFTIQPLN